MWKHGTFMIKPYHIGILIVVTKFLTIVDNYRSFYFPFQAFWRSCRQHSDMLEVQYTLSSIWQHNRWSHKKISKHVSYSLLTRKSCEKIFLLNTRVRITRLSWFWLLSFPTQNMPIALFEELMVKISLLERLLLFMLLHSKA